MEQATLSVVEEVKNSIMTNLHLSAQAGDNRLKYTVYPKSWDKVSPYLSNLDKSAIVEVCKDVRTEIIEWLKSTDLDLHIYDTSDDCVGFEAKW